MFNVTGIFAVAQIMVKDVTTLDNLQSVRVSATKLIENSYRVDDFAAMPSENRKFLEHGIKQLLVENLKNKLNQLGLSGR